ncbi:MAG: DUF1206 domain-containing protein [Leptolyngbya sp. SIO4C1]|nr:DUF1206 domain-containing protein [Leptolyngbya sp. SIO4C1]
MEQQHEEWIEKFARLGYLAKGIVYGTIGLLAVQAAFDTGGKTTGSQGALKSIAAQPFGKVLLVLLTFGLLGYVTWRFIQAVRDPEHRGHEASDIFRRIGYAISGLFYASLAVSAGRILMSAGSNSDSGDSTAQSWTAKLMSQPYGRWLVGAVGLFIIGLGCYYIYRAIKAKFRKRMKLYQMSNAEKTWATWVGRFGIAARGVVYAIIGAFTIQAALRFNPSQVKTSEGALQSLENNPTDEWLLGIVAFGLIAYAIHMGFQARYRSIDPL